MASNFSKSLWEVGTPLHSAWLAFAPREQRSKWEEKPGFFEDMNRRLEIAIDRTGRSFTALSTAYMETYNASQRLHELQTSLRKSLCIQISKSDFVATGFREAPTRSRTPVVIPQIYFENGEIDWDNSIISAFDYSYNHVRITAKSVAEELSSEQRIGRPGSRDAIRTAIDKLKSENADFCVLPRKRACQKIREELGAEAKPGNGLSDINLSKLIREKCGNRAIINPR